MDSKLICDFFVNSVPVMLILPLWVMLMIFVNSSVSFVSSKRLTLNLTLISTFISGVFAAFCLWACINNSQVDFELNTSWLNADILHISFGTFVDTLGASMLLLVCIVSFLVQLYSYGYMKEDESYHRYYIYLNLFNFSMMSLILSSNLVQTYVFWELVGVSSYLLIGFWYKKKSATDAAKKAFIVNRIGDVGLLLGIAILAYFALTFTSGDKSALLGFSDLSYVAEGIYSMISGLGFNVLCLLLLMGALAKSAQFPLHAWLADAMEAPTPVSALIHSATMVAAGVFLVVRLYPIFTLSNFAMAVIITVGMITALGGAYIAMSQNDIKKILAYSTSSQLGLMFVGLGVGAYSAAVFHLFVHGVSKALLFLCAGVVIKAMNGEQNIKYFGGLRKAMPICSVSYLIGCLSLAGLFIGGVYSKELIFDKVYDYGNQLLVISFIIVAFMTAFYLFRSYFLMFEGQTRFGHELKNSSLSVLVPSMILALTVLVIGSGLDDWLTKNIYFIVPDIYVSDIVASVVLYTVVLFAIYIAYRLYVTPYNMFVLIKEKVLSKENIFYRLSYNKFYCDEICSWIVEKILLRVCRFLDFVEKYIIDGVVLVVTLVTRLFSYVASKSQTGNVQTYIAYSLAIIALIMFVVGLFYTLGILLGV